MASTLMRAYGDAPAPGGVGPSRGPRRGGGHADAARHAADPRPRSAADISFSEILRMYRGSQHDAEHRGTTGGGHEFGSVEVFAGFEDESSDDSDLNARDVFGGGADGDPRGDRPSGDSDEEDAAWRAFCGGAADEETATGAGGGLADYLDDGLGGRFEDRLELADPDDPDAEDAFGDCGCN